MDIAESRGIPGFRGRVVTKADRDYDAVRAVWNVMHDRRPALIAQVASAADVAAASGSAGEHCWATSIALLRNTASSFRPGSSRTRAPAASRSVEASAD